MKRVQVLVVAFVAVCLLAIIVIAFLVSKPDPKSSQYATDALSDAVNKFSFDFYNAISDSQHEKNFVYSPLSLASAFGLLLLGSRKETEKQLFNAFSFNESLPDPRKVPYAFEALLESIDDVSNYSMFIANQIVVQHYFDLKSKFRKGAKTFYKSEIETTDFTKPSAKSVEKVNSWVAEKTKGNIKQLLDAPLPADTKMVILNAVYFHAQWSEMFEVNKTTQRPFFNKLGEVKQINFMNIKKMLPFYNDTSKGFRLLELQYSGNVSFFAILPNEHKDDVLPELMRNLTIADIEHAINGSKKRDVNVFLPKFKFDTELDLKNASEKLGIGEIYNNSADFTGITASHNLRVSKAVHKSVIDVNEEGTEAAASTGIVIQGRSFSRTIQMDLNRPFAFFIRNTETRLIYFMGSAQHF